MKAANKTLHQTTILLHPITTDKLVRLQCEFCIYREEKIQTRPLN
jgi:hypothetical protein